MPQVDHKLLSPRAFRDRLKFLVERYLLRGVLYRLLVIGVLLGMLALVAGLVVFAAGADFGHPGAAIWWAFLRLTDPGYLGDDRGVLLRTVSTVLTVLGFVIFVGALVATMTQWLNEEFRKLESGLTPVTLSHHILILGWTNRTATIVRDLLMSEGRVQRFLRRRGTRNLRIVLLVEKLDAALVNELRERLGPLWNERQIIFRSGTPLRLEHLRRVDFMNAAAIILPGADFAYNGDALRPDRGAEAVPSIGAGAGSASMTDTRAIKTLLSLANHPESRSEGAVLPFVVAEIFDARKLSIAREAYGGRIEIVASDTMISRLIAQNVRNQGLSDVYSELLTQGVGSEVYIRECPELEGVPLQDLTDVFSNGIVLGVVRQRDGRLRPALNPPDGFRVDAGDRLAVIARGYEDSAPDPGRKPTTVPRGVPAADQDGAPRLRRVLILGWNHKVPALLQEFNSYGDESYEVDLLSAVSATRRESRLARHEFHPSRVRVRNLEGDYTLVSDLTALDPASYDNVVLLGSDWLRSGEESDARTVVGYLLLHELLPGDGSGPALLVELMDPANLALFRRRAGEVLISPSILSHVLAQVALRHELRVVFDELFGPGGAEIRFRPAGTYGLPGREASFRDVQHAVALQGETALGVRTGAGGLHARALVNPPREQRWTLAEADEVLVLMGGG